MWLSEIEERQRARYEATPEVVLFGSCLEDGISMARVLREFASCLKAIEAGRPIDKAIEALPDDAKELLKETEKIDDRPGPILSGFTFT